MSEKQSLAELAEQYWESVRTLDKQIERNKELMKSCESDHERNEYRIKIRTLRDMRKECEQIANKLANYYDPEHKPYVCHGTTRMYCGGRRARKLSPMG